MGLASFNRRREMEKRGDFGIMQGQVEQDCKAKAAKLIDAGEIPNPVDGDDPMPSTNRLNPGSPHGHGPSRQAEVDYLNRHGVDGTEGAHPSSVPLNRGGAAVLEETHASMPEAADEASVDTPGANESTVKRTEAGLVVNAPAMTEAEKRGTAADPESGMAGTMPVLGGAKDAKAATREEAEEDGNGRRRGPGRPRKEG